MTRRHLPDDDDDEFEPDEEPRVRPGRMLLGSVLGLVGMALSLMAGSYLLESPSEPQGSAAAIGHTYGSAIAWIVLVVGALVAAVATVTLVIAILDAQDARRRPPL